jgi:hypothetical protein
MFCNSEILQLARFLFIRLNNYKKAELRFMSTAQQHLRQGSDAPLPVIKHFFL